MDVVKKKVMNSRLKVVLEELIDVEIGTDRKEVLTPLIEFITNEVKLNGKADLNFICTHNSRRSQFSQLWAKTASDYFKIPINSFSGGVEVTAFNERAIDSCGRFGFEIDVLKPGENPVYSITGDASCPPIKMFSKLFDDKANASKNFAAVMTCAHADENCPFTPGATERIPVRYEDPKAYDDTDLESKIYDLSLIHI